jgi:hypothetical protein
MDGIPPRPPLDRSRRLSTGRRVALGGLLAALCAAVLAFALASRDSAPASNTKRVPNSTSAATTAPPNSSRPKSTGGAVRSFAADVGDRAGCQTLNASEPQLLCPLPGGVVTYTQVADVRAAHTRVDRVADPGPISDGPTGSPSAADDPCATGRSSSRAWARPQTPQTSAGEYACRTDENVAEIWWTVDDARVFAHAVRHDGDLAELFSWWRTRNEHP